MKTFTLEEARVLLPVLRSLLQRSIDARKRAEAAELELTLLGRKIQLSGGMLVDVRKAAHSRATHHHAVQQVNDAVQEIDSIGVQVKDLDSGLLDCPFQLENETVLLCWKLGEPDIAFWHSLEDGFRGRQALDQRFTGKERQSPQAGSSGGSRPSDGGKPN